MQTRIIVGIVVLAISGASGLYLVMKDARSAGHDAKNDVISKNVQNATFEIDSTRVTLHDGESSVSAAPGSAAAVVTRYFGNEARGDFNRDGYNDVAFILTQSPGGSGTFYYVAVALGTKSGYRGTNAIVLGDRISPQTTEYRLGKIIVNFADRKPTDAMTVKPSVGVSKYFEVQGDSLVESQ